MVATRRMAAQRRERETGGGKGSGSPCGTAPADASEMASDELNTSVSVRMTTRRTAKSICKPEVVQESQFEELERAETRSNVSDSLEMEMTGNDNTALRSTQPVPESQADGDVSETESNCSAVSGLQTPLYVRVTRRRQIVIPYQPDYSGKKTRDRTAFLNKLKIIPDEDDVSEAESCSSAVSGVQMPNATRSTRSRQSKKKLQPYTVHEDQSEDISDAESYLSTHLEPCVITKRITRSMQMKSQAENSTQTEKESRVVSEDEDLMKDTIKSELVIISDSRPAAELVPDTEGASGTEDDNKESSSLKSKCFSESADASQSKEVKKEVLNDVTPSSLRKMRGNNTESPGKKSIKKRHSAGGHDSGEACSQIQGEHCRVLVSEGESEHMDLSLADCLSPKEFLESEGQVKLSKSKKIPECKKADVEADDAQQSFTHADKLRKGKRSSAVISPQKDIVVAQRADSLGRCSTLQIDVVSDEEQTGEQVESLSQSREISSHRDDSLALFLSEDKTDEPESNGEADIGIVEESPCYKEANNRTPSHKKSPKPSSLHPEELFVIDTEPGMSSSRKYYLDQDSDAESKQPEECEEHEESSDLEEADEELVDEDEKDEDDSLLETKLDVLHLSSKIDPGLNMKKLGGLYISFDAKNQKPKSSVIKQLKEKKKDPLLQKSIITPDFERKECVPPFRESLRQLKKQRRAEREKTTGDGWFGMKAPEITNELKNDLKVLKMRASLDPKHFYKKNDRDGLPKYFQVGTVVDSPIDFYHSRIPKKQRKRTIVEELLADSEFRRYNKKKYQEIMSEKAAFAAGKRKRKMKKFRN